MAKDEVISYYGFQYLPDHVLLYIFSYLRVNDLARAACTCSRWNEASLDDLLWKELFYRRWRIERTVPMAPGKSSWKAEFKRLHYYTPVVESEVIKKHKDQVLHVSFSHSGEMFATCSKDGTVKVWVATFPATLKFEHDMKVFTWKYTQFSNFNESDTLLLVSGVHFGNMSTSGEIAVFSLIDNFQLQCRVINKPYDVFGTWYDNSHLLSGNLHWTGHLNSCSALWLNKASQATESELESVVMRLFRFNNINASSIRTIMISNIYAETKDDSSSLNNAKTECDPSKAEMAGRGDNPRIHNSENIQQQMVSHNFDTLENNGRTGTSQTNSRQDIGDRLNGTIKYNPDYREAEVQMKGSVENGVYKMDIEQDLPCACCNNDEDGTSAVSNFDEHQPHLKNLPDLPTSKHLLSTNKLTPENSDKLLIFTMGSLTYTPHQIGIKRIKYQDAASFHLRLHSTRRGNGVLLPNVDENDHGVNRPYDNVDETFDMDGHIIGMSLSPDHRYLYVNSRPWPQGFEIKDPLQPPPIAQEIDVHVIDLYKMKEVGTMLRSHKAFTPNDECFFIFLDVCNEYVASGAEDKHGYIWDRHYGTCLHRFPHSDVVNCVAFNPVDPEVLVTVSDDHSIKVWRSKNKEKELKSKETVR